MARAATWVVISIDRVPIVNTSPTSTGSMSRRAENRRTPTLFTRTSSPPRRDMARSIASRVPPASERSTAYACPPISSVRRAAASAQPSRTATSAASAAKVRTIAAPIPWAPPVTITRRPANRFTTGPRGRCSIGRGGSGRNGRRRCGSPEPGGNVASVLLVLCADAIPLLARLTLDGHTFRRRSSDPPATVGP